VVVVLHAVWVLWVVGGLFATGMKRALRSIHLACVALTLVIAVTRGICPLTDLEVYFFELAGEPGYTGGFIQHYAASFVYGDLIHVTSAGLMVGLILICALAIARQWGDRLSNLK
jgi:hypothetical protein